MRTGLTVVDQIRQTEYLSGEFSFLHAAHMAAESAKLVAGLIKLWQLYLGSLRRITYEKINFYIACILNGILP